MRKNYQFSVFLINFAFLKFIIMISRRLLRIKAMQTYYAFRQDGTQNLEDALKELNKSALRSYDLYLSIFCLLIQLRDYAANKIEIRQHKMLPLPEDLNPNKKFVDNPVFEKIRKNYLIEQYIGNREYNWSNNPELIKNLWSEIENSDFYHAYMKKTNPHYEHHKDIVRSILNEVITNNESLDQLLEEKSIYWNDDLEFLAGIIIKNINTTEIKHEFVILDELYKSDDDKKFGIQLLKNTILNADKYDDIIVDLLQKWDLQRVAFLDKIILHLAITELLKMPEIPVKVTINEYLDIAKYYSTQKSNNFINGILDAVYNHHKNAGTLNKSGKGMVF